MKLQNKPQLQKIWQPKKKENIIYLFLKTIAKQKAKTTINIPNPGDFVGSGVNVDVGVGLGVDVGVGVGVGVGVEIDSI